jgi:hypothetical protein
MIYFILGTLFGGTIVFLIFRNKNENKNGKQVAKIFKKTPIKKGHIPPRYYGYKGGFANVTICQDCGSTGLYQDQHPIHPCYFCGGKITNYIYDDISGSKKFVAKWCEYNGELQWLSRIDYENMSEDEIKRNVRERKLNRILN